MDLPHRLLCCVFFAAAAGNAQPFYVGVKAGALLTTSKDSSRSTDRSGQTDTTLELKRYSVGPSFEIALPARLRVETALLYRSFEAGSVTVFGNDFTTFRSFKENWWEVPLALRREFSSGKVRPFAGAGGVWARRLTDVSQLRVDNLSQPPSQMAGQWSDSDDLFGWIGSAGVRFRLPAGVKITPEIRYTRWTAKRWLPSQNQVDVFLAIGF